MKLGLTLPNLTTAATRQNALTLAREAERLGYDSLWVTDRLLYPIQPRQLMRGHPWPEVYRYALDPLDTLIFAAGVTEKIRLGTSVLNLPMYVPAPLAKRIATLDVLSSGRADLIIGWRSHVLNYRATPHFNEAGQAYIFYSATSFQPAMHTLQKVVIVRLSSGKINTLYTFFASASPLTANLPITYTWSPAPGSGQGTAQATYTWSGNGRKTIHVSVANLVNSIFDSQTITLGTPTQILKAYCPMLSK